MKIAVYPVTFAPKDVAAITGLSPAMQRDWRRNGYLPPRETGWSNFTLHEVAAIAIRKAVTDIGIGPAFADRILTHGASQQAIKSVVWWALEAQSVADWTSLKGDAISRLVDWDDDDHHGVVDTITGSNSTDRGRLLTFYPELNAVEVGMIATAPDDDGCGTVEIMILLDRIGRGIAKRAGRGLVNISIDNAS
jgi:hypothetical protein